MKENFLVPPHLVSPRRGENDAMKLNRSKIEFSPQQVQKNIWLHTTNYPLKSSVLTLFFSLNQYLTPLSLAMPTVCYSFAV